MILTPDGHYLVAEGNDPVPVYFYKQWAIPTCTRCGVRVENVGIHNDWHERLEAN